MRPDTSITYLKSLGYNVLRLPRADVMPLQILLRKGKDLIRLGHIGELMKEGSVPVPEVTPDSRNGDISGRESSKVDLGIGLTILGNIIRSLGGANLGLNASYKSAKTVTFQYKDVLENNISVVKLEQYLNAASVRPENSTGLVDKLIDDDVYIVTSTIKSKSFGVKAQASNGAEVKLEVPVIEGAVGGNVKVSTEAGVESQMNYSGEQAVVFGVQAAQLVFDDDKHFTTVQPLKPGDAAVRGKASEEDIEASAGELETGPVYLQVPGVFSRLEDSA